MRARQVVIAPAELKDGLPEALKTALIASDFNLNDLLDAYIQCLKERPNVTWSMADYHAKVLVRMIMSKQQWRDALEQALSTRIRERLHAVA